MSLYIDEVHQVAAPFGRQTTSLVLCPVHLNALLGAKSAIYDFLVSCFSTLIHFHYLDTQR